jgi:hypothetical protein
MQAAYGRAEALRPVFIELRELSANAIARELNARKIAITERQAVVCGDRTARAAPAEGVASGAAFNGPDAEGGQEPARHRDRDAGARVCHLAPRRQAGVGARRRHRVIYGRAFGS